MSKEESIKARDAFEKANPNHRMPEEVPLWSKSNPRPGNPLPPLAPEVYDMSKNEDMMDEEANEMWRDNA